MIRLDSHQHFWKYNPAHQVWMTDEMAVLRRDYLPDELKPLLQAIQFEGTIARYGNVWEEAIRLVASWRVNLQPLISRMLPLKQATEALELACAKTGVVKVQIDLT